MHGEKLARAATALELELMRDVRRLARDLHSAQTTIRAFVGVSEEEAAANAKRS